MSMLGTTLKTLPLLAFMFVAGEAHARAKHEVSTDQKLTWHDVTSKWTGDAKSVGATEYIEGTGTSDVSRQKRNPMRVEFQDRFNVWHRVTIENNGDEYKMIIPASETIKWYGEVDDRTGFDRQTRFVELDFRYEHGSNSWWNKLPKGIRIEARGYKAPDMGEASIDSARWKDAVELTVKATEGAKNLADVVAAGKGK